MIAWSGKDWDASLIRHFLNVTGRVICPCALSFGGFLLGWTGCAGWTGVLMPAAMAIAEHVTLGFRGLA